MKHQYTVMQFGNGYRVVRFEKNAATNERFYTLHSPLVSHTEAIRLVQRANNH